jgi:hypothetical protein
MQHRKYLSALLLSVTLCAWGADLKRVDASYFNFGIPADMVKIRARGIDSHVGAYQNSRMRLGFDYGANSDPLDYDSGLPGYRSSKVTVGGREARMVSFRQSEAWFTAIHFPDVGKTSGDGVKLTMHASCRTEQDLELAREIFTSIRFN